MIKCSIVPNKCSISRLILIIYTLKCYNRIDSHVFLLLLNFPLRRLNSVKKTLIIFALLTFFLQAK